MKIIIAFVRDSKTERVLHALESCDHFPGVSISSCEGEGRGRGAGGGYQADKALSRPSMRRMEIFCSDDHAEHLVELIRTAAYTGNPGDGIIAIQDLREAVRIRGGARNEDAV